MGVLTSVDPSKWTETRLDAFMTAAGLGTDDLVPYAQFLEWDSTASSREIQSDPSGCNKRLTDALKELHAVAWEQKEPAIEIMLKLLQNVVANPSNLKFRRIRRTNEKLRDKVFSVPG